MATYLELIDELERKYFPPKAPPGTNKMWGIEDTADDWRELARAVAELHGRDEGDEDYNDFGIQRTGFLYLWEYAIDAAQGVIESSGYYGPDTYRAAHRLVQDTDKPAIDFLLAIARAKEVSDNESEERRNLCDRAATTFASITDRMFWGDDFAERVNPLLEKLLADVEIIEQELKYLLKEKSD